MWASPFTATRWQVATYLCGVALFSISFLVFLNSSLSFVVSQLLGLKDRTGDIVGTLGFADELLALFACPFWGLVSDQLGIRWVCALGYIIIGLSLLLLVQSTNVYPQLLLARLLFSIGGAAVVTMVTATLPAMTSTNKRADPADASDHGRSASVSTQGTITYQSIQRRHQQSIAQDKSNAEGTSQVAGFVGMFTGLGALVALGLFLPLPTYFGNSGATREQAVRDSFYVVGSLSLAVAALCYFGLGELQGEQAKGWRRLCSNGLRLHHSSNDITRSLVEAVSLGLRDGQISLGYMGGFVARASSVGVSLFIPLFVNAYFISSGQCRDKASDPSAVKEHCQQAYKLAAALTGTAELFALLFAPIFGFLEGRLRRTNSPLAAASAAGILGYLSLAFIKNPEPKVTPIIFGIMALIGLSQIGAIVCSLSILGRGIQSVSRPSGGHAEDDQSDEPLLHDRPQPLCTREDIKGSVAGVYSFGGGAGILLLTKLGGVLFDKLSPGAPFVIMAIYNGLLLVAALSNALLQRRVDP